MKRAGILVAILLLVSCGAAQAMPHWSVLLGGGVSVPVGDSLFKAYAKTGWQGMVGVAWHNADWPVAIRTEFVYGQHNHDDTSGDKTNLYGPLVSVVYRLVKNGEMKVRPYVLASGGVLNHHYSPGDAMVMSESEWKAAFGGGAGVGITAGKKISVFVEGRYLNRDGSNTVPVIAGVHISVQ